MSKQYAPCPYCGKELDITKQEYKIREEKYVCKHCNKILIGEEDDLRVSCISLEEEKLELILKSVKHITLSKEEKNFIIWFSKWDMDTIKNFVSIVEKLRSE